MSAGRAIALGLLALLLEGATDRPPAAGRVMALPAARERLAEALQPRFALFGWVSPPIESTTAARYAELAGAGLNLTVLAPGDSGTLADNRARLAVAAPVGVRCLLFDRRFYQLDPRTPSGSARMDSIIADYHDDPAFFGWYFGDEPAPSLFDTLGVLADSLRRRDPAHPAWNNLLGRGAFPTRETWLSYLRAYLDQVHPRILCDDHYDFTIQGDRGLFVENAAGLAALARERGIPFWAIVLLTGHGTLREPTEGELRWQVSMLLAYDARGVGYFTYWTPAPDPQYDWQPAVIAQDGSRTSWYDRLARFNPRVLRAGEVLAGLTWMSTTHAGSLPQGGTAFAPDGWVSAVSGRAALGEFVDSSGVRWLLVANADSLRAATLQLRLTRTTAAWRVEGGTDVALAGSLSAGDLVAPVALDPGDFALLRLEGALGGSGTGFGPRLSVAPVPAGGRAHVGYAAVAQRGRLEILDGTGRRVWSRSLPEGSGTLEWSGELESGGTARAGIYFARIEDSRGVAVARLAWLGVR